MRSSISSSDRKNKWRATWILSIGIVLLFLVLLEVSFRLLGYKPSISDDAALWSLERNKLGNSDKEFVLIGASRIQLGFDMELFRHEYPGYEIVNLAIDGSVPARTLQSLAMDEDFKGKVLCSINEAAILNADPARSQNFHNNYYENSYNFNTRLNREVSTFFQSHLAFKDPIFNPVNFIDSWVSNKRIPSGNYLRTSADRSRRADYSLVDLPRHRQHRINTEISYLDFLKPKISFRKFKSETALLKKWAGIIKSRGGKVAFIRYPTSDELLEREDDLFNPGVFWKYFRENIDCPVIYFRDIPEMNQFKLPESSHLDTRDIPRFTRLIIDELKGIKFFE